MHLSHLLLALSILAAPLTAAETSAKVSDAYIRENLAKIPATDPAPTAVPALREAVRGRHPRLLLTADEAATLKQVALADPVLKPVYESVATSAKRFTLGKERPLGIVLSDTPAIAGSCQAAPATAVAYALDRDPAVKQAIIDALTAMLGEEHWAKDRELDSTMGAARNMLMVGLFFDAVRDDLDADFRARMAAKILVHARRLHWLGYQQLCTGSVKYWQQDPQPNHRWYRGAGMAACLLAIVDEPGIDCGHLLQEFKKEMDLLIRWFPTDGDCHEGAGYQVFGFSSLVMAAGMMDCCLGTTYLQAPGFRNACMQQIYYTAPGRMGRMSFGDDQNGEGMFSQNDSAFFLSPRLSRDKNAQAALLRDLERRGQPYLTKHKPLEKRLFTAPWGMLLFYDPTVGTGDHRALPTARLFADIGAASMRSSWEDDAAALTFKCGPIGGYHLNAYAWEHRNEKGEPHYVNVAHDDSDANTFALAMAGDFVFHPGLYSWSKLTRSQNGITVDGKGQLCEGTDYTQPVPGSTDMRTLAGLTGWKQDAAGRIIVEGEAAASYRGMGYSELVERQKGKPATDTTPAVAAIPGLPDAVLSRFRRATVWLPGDYALILDDIAATTGSHALTWRGTVEKAFFDDPAAGLCHVTTKGGLEVPFQMLADRPFTGAIDYLYLDGRWGNELKHQFQFTANAPAVRFACILDPWKRKLRTAMEPADGGTVLRVRGDGIDDTWTWKPAADQAQPSTITGQRAGKPLIALGAGDKAPRGE